MFEKDISKDALNDLPLRRYEGKIIVITQIEKITQAVEEINQHPVIGFDTERRPSFNKGEFHSISLLQIALPNKVFLFRLKFAGFPPLLTSIFTNSKIKKVGVGIKDDLIFLQQITPFEPHSTVDLNEIATGLEIKCRGVRKLTGLILGYRISKNQQISNWDLPKLTDKQLNYAALDAHVCLAIYQKLSNWGYV